MQNAGEIATYQPTQPGCSLPNGMQTQPRLEGDVQQQGCANWQNCQKTENTRHFLREKKNNSVSSQGRSCEAAASGRLTFLMSSMHLMM